MHFSVERLRRWLLACAGLLVLVIAGFLGLAHYRSHRFLTNLPGKLGVDIRQETNAYTYSQTVKGKTVFTVHAAKAIQHKDGKYTLHDVGIAVYGHGEERGDRVDRIYGKEFDLDQAAGVVRAVGEVHLDLEAPAATDAKGKMDYAAGKDLKEPAGTVAPEAWESHEVGKGDARLIHVKTRGLVYLEKLGVAATDEDIEFEFNGLTGHAKGAEYNADTGVLVLQSAVKVSGLEKGQPVVLTASRAELDRTNRRAVLAQAKYVTIGGEGRGTGARRTIEARRAVVVMREDGSAERLEGEDGVTLTGGDSSRMTAQRGEVLLGPTSKPQSMRMMGDVRYSADDAERQARGQAAEVHATFDSNGHVEKVALSGGVQLHESLVAEGAKSPVTSERELSASTVELAMAVDEFGRARLRDAKASGDARLRVSDVGKGGKGSRASAMGADVLTAHFTTARGGRQQLDEVKGDGRTRLEQVNEAGVVTTSSGDALEVRFRSVASSQLAKKGSVAGADVVGREEVASALQQGNLVLTRKIPARPGQQGAPQVDRATAAKAVYDGDTQTMTLTGGVEMATAGGTLWADRVVMEQRTGDATTDGSVKASFRQGSQAEVTHVLAERAELKKESDLALFFGSANRPARLWQGGSQVEAPVLEFAHQQRRLVARGDRTSGAMPVRTVLVRTGKRTDTSAAGDSSKASAAMRRPAVVRATSREMTYSDEARRAEFTGGVKVESSDGVMRGQEATAYLEKPETSASATKKNADIDSPFLGGAVERVVVSGDIQIEQAGRRATGERLVYTAAEGLFVLTGTTTSAPRVMDETRGTVTGAELRFRAQDESVVISNGDTNGAGQRVHTETRVKRER
jgi:lipopolysaccharide export system protein LptA